MNQDDNDSDPIEINGQDTGDFLMSENLRMVISLRLRIQQTNICSVF